MIKLSLKQANQPDTQVQVDGDSATIGRAPGVEVLIQQPYVSKRHVRVLQGVVLVDLGSSNGTFVDGVRISEPTVLKGDEFQLGEGDVTVRVLRENAGAAPAGGSGANSEALESLRKQLAEREEELRAAHAIVDRLHAKAEVLRSENQRLRVQTPPPSDVTPAPSLASAPALSPEGAALDRATAELADVGRERDQLARELEQARADAERQHANVARLEAAHAELQRESARLSASLAAAASLDELEALRKENQSLRREVDELRQRPSAPSGPMGELLIRLQAENSELKRQSSVSNLPPTAAAGSGRPSEPPSKLLAELLDLRAQNAALQARLGSRGAPVPARHMAPAGGAARVLRHLADQDIERTPTDFEAAPEEFVSAELFRVVRQIERVVTRLAGDHIQLFQSNTMLPNVEGNLRGLIATVIGDPSEVDARHELARYFDQMAKWLVATLAAHRKATRQFAEKLKTDLSEAGLLSQGAIPAFRKLSGGADAELWKRACHYLRELTPDTLDDMIEKFSRDAVNELLGASAPE